jgi:hypothetical protein
MKMRTLLLLPLIGLFLYSCKKENSTPPTAPTGLQATAISTAQIKLTWTDIQKNEDALIIERKGDTGTFRPVITLEKIITTYTDSGLEEGATYTYRIQSFKNKDNGIQVVYSGEATATTLIDLQTRLIAYYPFSGNAIDSSGNGYHGTVYNAVLTTDRSGHANSAYQFTDSQYIIVNNSANLNLYPLTISLWYAVDEMADGMIGNILSRYLPAAWNGFQLLVSTSNGIIEVTPWYLNSNRNRIIGNYGEPPFLQKNISAKTWYHFVFTVDPSGGKIFVNGQLIDEHPWTGTPLPPTSSYLLKIGGMYFSNNWFHGKIDNVRLYNRALNKVQIKALYNGNL